MQFDIEKLINLEDSEGIEYETIEKSIDVFNSYDTSKKEEIIGSTSTG